VQLAGKVVWTDNDAEPAIRLSLSILAGDQTLRVPEELGSGQDFSVVVCSAATQFVVTPRIVDAAGQVTLGEPVRTVTVSRAVRPLPVSTARTIVKARIRARWGRYALGHVQQYDCYRLSTYVVRCNVIFNPTAHVQYGYGFDVRRTADSTRIVREKRISRYRL
jgi:hypothetical protein